MIFFFEINYLNHVSDVYYYPYESFYIFHLWYVIDMEESLICMIRIGSIVTNIPYMELVVKLFSNSNPSLQLSRSYKG